MGGWVDGLGSEDEEYVCDFLDGWMGGWEEGTYRWGKVIGLICAASLTSTFANSLRTRALISGWRMISYRAALTVVAVVSDPAKKMSLRLRKIDLLESGTSSSTKEERGR